MISLRNKIGQMLIMGFSGTEIHAKSPVTKWLTGDGLGGIILFDKDLHTGLPGKNLVNQVQIKLLLQQLQENAKTAISLPLFTAIDYEGGAVDRFTQIEGCLATMKACDQRRLEAEAFDEEIRLMAELLKELGFNLNFAPIVDLNLNEKTGIIGRLGRSFSEDPLEVAKLARRFVDLFEYEGIVCSYKHFPGHGSALGDTHEGFVDITETWQEKELVPYRELFKNPAQNCMIMTAHVINKNLDASGLPASLSHQILTKLLREELGYNGVIISDDLQMHAIASHYSVDEALSLTINAGADMVIFGNQLGEIGADEVVDKIERLVQNNTISCARIDEAYNRIVRLKLMIM